MCVNFKKIAILFIGIAFFCATNAEASSDLENQCVLSFKSLQQKYTRTNANYTLISGDGKNMFPFSLSHRYHQHRDYSLWKSLNGEVSGYFLRDGLGFDFNQDKNAATPLSWHQINIWDRLFSEHTSLKDYHCMIAGRTRLSDRKVSIIRFAPKDDLRYSYVIARDEDKALPVELNVINPQGRLVLKITSTAMVDNINQDFLYNDDLFDRFELLQKSNNNNTNIKPWGILNIPPQFKLLEEGSVYLNDKEVPFQRYGDGLVDFRVYRHSILSMYIPSAVNGTLSVLRRGNSKYEYAVVGEVPLQLSEFVLKRVSPRG